LQQLIRANLSAWAPATPRLRRVLKHAEWVGAVGFSRDGKILLTAEHKWVDGSSTATARLWDVATGKPIGVPIAYKWVKDVALSPDGTTLATGQDDDTDIDARIWDTATGKLIRSIPTQKLIGSIPLLSGLGLRLVSWGDGSAAPTSGNDLVIVGIDNNGLLHVRIFDAGGNRITDTEEAKLPSTEARAVSTLKQQLPGLLPPHLLTDAEQAGLIREATSIVGQTVLNDHRSTWSTRAGTLGVVKFSPDGKTLFTPNGLLVDVATGQLVLAKKTTVANLTGGSVAPTA
jgi:hypothetical protein